MNTIELPQGTLAYDDVGQGPPVVFVHGLLVNRLLWRNVVPTLSKHARCIVPDLPLGSHRIPMKADADLSVDGVAQLIADFIEALDLKDVTLVGNDSGGAISQVVAARHRDRIGRLVLTTCDAYEVFPPPEFAYLKWMSYVPGLTGALARGMLHVPPLRRLPMAYGMLSKTRIPEDVLTEYVRPSATSAGVRRDVAKFTRSTNKQVTMRVAEELRSFPHPALLLWATNDRFFPISLAERLTNEMPNARLVPLENTGVFTPEDAPERVAEEIAAFVADVPVIETRAAPN